MDGMVGGRCRDRHIADTVYVCSRMLIYSKADVTVRTHPPGLLISVTCTFLIALICMMVEVVSSIWCLALAKFLLNPQALRVGADPRSRWTV